MIIHDQQAKAKLVQRLRRVEGQIRGIEGMIDAERDCQEIQQQLLAVRSAIQSINRSFLQEYASACLLEMDEEATPSNRQAMHSKREKIVQEMIALLDKSA